MIRTIYHGSDQIVRTPVFGAGAARNDYGLGFYCTESPALADEWAVTRSTNGFSNRYRIETDGLRVLNLNSPEYCILHWLAVLLNFREFDAGSAAVYQAKDYIRSAFNVDYQNCDCMVGFRSDNSNFLFAQRFLDGTISYRQFNDAVRLGDTGRQFVLKSNRAFDRVIFDGYSIVMSREAFPAAASRDRQSMERFAAIRSAGTKDASRDIYISQILDEGIRPYDARLAY